MGGAGGMVSHARATSPVALGKHPADLRPRISQDFASMMGGMGGAGGAGGAGGMVRGLPLQVVRTRGIY